jgi:anti-sigma-K factor RskA
MSSLPPDLDRDAGTGEPPDDEVLAGELVLGVLPAPQRRAAQVRGEADPAFAARIAGWERRFAPLLAEIEPVPAPTDAWAQLCRRLGWRTEGRAPAGLWHSLALWRTVSALAALAAIALWLDRPSLPLQPPAAVVVLPQPQPEAAARPVTTLAQDDGSPGWLASVDPARGTVLVVPVPRAADSQGRVPELWIIAAGKAPRSLGLVSISKSHTVEVPADARAALTAGSVLAITLESPQGVPHAAPAGPIIAKGALQT